MSHYRPTFEALEDRRLLSASLEFVSGSGVGHGSGSGRQCAPLSDGWENQNESDSQRKSFEYESHPLAGGAAGFGFTGDFGLAASSVTKWGAIAYATVTQNFEGEVNCPMPGSFVFYREGLSARSSLDASINLRYYNPGNEAFVDAVVNERQRGVGTGSVVTTLNGQRAPVRLLVRSGDILTIRFQLSAQQSTSAPIEGPYYDTVAESQVELFVRELVQAAWLVHGYKQPFEDFDDFIRPWVNEYSSFLANALELSGPRAQVNVFEWQSSEGWNLAAGLLGAKIAVLASPIPSKVPLIRALDSLMINQLQRAKDVSVFETDRLIREILITNLYQGVAGVSLIGHSRGGELIARANTILRRGLLPEIPISSVLLDAHGTDWPGLGGILGSDRPFPAGTAADTNVLVDDGLVGFLGDFTRQAINLLGGLLLPPDAIPDIETFLSAGNWKAPERSKRGYIDDRSLLGLDSDHFNVHELFFFQSDEKIASYFQPPLNASGEENSTPTAPFALSRLSGGSFEEFENSARQFEAFNDDELPLFARELVSALSNAEAWFRLSWDVDGDVWLDDRERLIAIGPEGVLRQSIAFPNPEMVFTLTHSPDSLTDNSSLTIWLDEDPIAVLGTEELQQPTIEFSFGESHGKGSLKLAYSGPEGSAFQLRSIEAEEQFAAFSGEVVPSAQGIVAQVRVVGDELPSGEVSFFTEANGVAGLQLGESGDRALSSQYADKVWTLEDPALAVGDFVYASYEHSGQRVAEDVYLVSQLTKNVQQPLDVSMDGFVTPIDALIQINMLNGDVPYDEELFYRADVDADGVLSPSDVLRVVNYLNADSSSAGESDELFEPFSTDHDDDTAFYIEAERLAHCLALDFANEIDDLRRRSSFGC